MSELDIISRHLEVIFECLDAFSTSLYLTPEHCIWQFPHYLSGHNSMLLTVSLECFAYPTDIQYFRIWLESREQIAFLH